MHSVAVSVRRWIACGAGVGAVVIAQLSPLEPASHRWFAAHMIQHLVLMLVAAPLLVAGRTNVLLLRIAPAEWRPVLLRWGRRSRVWRHPALVWVLFATALWGWHLPGPYDAALRNPWIHLAEHTSFLGTSILWWAALFGRRRLAHAPAMIFVFTTMLHAAWLAAVLTFSTRVLYPFYATHAASTFGRSVGPLADQQLAGVLMWIPPGILYVCVIVVLFFQWFAAVDTRVRRAEAVHP